MRENEIDAMVRDRFLAELEAQDEPSASRAEREAETWRERTFARLRAEVEREWKQRDWWKQR